MSTTATSSTATHAPATLIINGRAYIPVPALLAMGFCVSCHLKNNQPGNPAVATPRGWAHSGCVKAHGPRTK